MKPMVMEFMKRIRESRVVTMLERELFRRVEVGGDGMSELASAAVEWVFTWFVDRRGAIVCRVEGDGSLGVLDGSMVEMGASSIIPSGWTIVDVGVQKEILEVCKCSERQDIGLSLI